MSAKKLSYEDYLKSLELAPRLTVELLIINNKKEILLLQRDREPFVDHWYFPGSFLLKDESIAELVDRVAYESLGTKLKAEGKEMGLFENLNGDPRGHLLQYALLFNEDIKTEAKNAKFFSEIPEKMIPYHKNILKKLALP